jgi:hypothetical protein
MPYLWFAANESIATATLLSFTLSDVVTRTLNHSKDALPSPCQVTLAGFFLFVTLERVGLIRFCYRESGGVR